MIVEDILLCSFVAVACSSTQTTWSITRAHGREVYNLPIAIKTHPFQSATDLSVCEIKQYLE